MFALEVFFCFAIESTEGVKFIWYDTVSSESLYICCVELQSRQSCPDIHKMQHEAVVFYNNQCYARYMSYLAASLPFLDSFSWINLSCTLDVCITSSDFSLLSLKKVSTVPVWLAPEFIGREIAIGAVLWMSVQPLRTLMSVWRTLCHLDDELWYVVFWHIHRLELMLPSSMAFLAQLSLKLFGLFHGYSAFFTSSQLLPVYMASHSGLNCWWILDMIQIFKQT